MDSFSVNSWPKRKAAVEFPPEPAEAESHARFPAKFSAIEEAPSNELGWRMAVLPFRNVGSPAGYRLSLGMAEEISAVLSRFRAPRLVAPATFFDGVGPAADAMARCRSYKLDYILDGTIEVDGTEVRTHLSLIDAVLDFEVIWTGNLVGRLDDLYALQERAASETIAQLDPDLSLNGYVAEPPVKTEVPEAHHALLAAIQSIYRLEKLKFLRAREHLLRAVSLDPKYASAQAWLAYWSIMAVGQGWVDNPREVISLAGEAAAIAIELDPLDARAVAIAGHVRAYLFHEVSEAVALHKQAIELNPNLPIVWTLSSWSRIYSGDHATAIRHAQMAQSLSPRDPHIFFTEHASMTAHFFQRDLETAELMADVVLTRNPGHASALNVQLAIFGHLGRTDEAAQCLSQLRQIDPAISVASITARSPLRDNDKTYYAEGLRLAGVPDQAP